MDIYSIALELFSNRVAPEDTLVRETAIEFGLNPDALADKINWFCEDEYNQHVIDMRVFDENTPVKVGVDGEEYVIKGVVIDDEYDD